MDPQLCNHLMEEDEGNMENTNNTAGHRNASVEAAGVVRGVSRSVARSIVKPIAKHIPKQVPKMTKQLLTRRGQLRVKGVAKVSDRISTGWDVYASAKESVVEGDAPKTKKKTPTTTWAPVFQSVRTFTATLLRNSIVGAAVFETYVYTISKADAGMPPSDHQEERGGEQEKDVVRPDESFEDDSLIQSSDDDDDDDDTDETIPPWDQPDAFSRAPLMAHVGAGALAGSLDGFLSSIWETKSLVLQKARQAVLQQGISHAFLFGSYEYCKRHLMHQLHSFPMLGEWKDTGWSHLGCIAIAGGVAGQLQFLTNHYGEQIVQAEIPLSHQPSQHQLSVYHLRRLLLRITRLSLKRPSMGSMMSAFVPSAVGFVAFEYGKHL